MVRTHPRAGRCWSDRARDPSDPFGGSGVRWISRRSPRSTATTLSRSITTGACRLPTLEDAEDATSLIFTKALATLATQREPSSLRSWLFTIAHNVIADHYRARHPTLPLTDVATEMETRGTPGSPGPGPRRGPRPLGAASSEQARIIELRLAGLTREEIAQVLGKSPTRSKWRNSAPTPACVT